MESLNHQSDNGCYLLDLIMSHEVSWGRYDGFFCDNITRHISLNDSASSGDSLRAIDCYCLSYKKLSIYYVALR